MSLEYKKKKLITHHIRMANVFFWVSSYIVTPSKGVIELTPFAHRHHTLIKQKTMLKRRFAKIAYVNKISFFFSKHQIGYRIHAIRYIMI